MMTPEMPSNKASVWTPPPAPNMFNEIREVKADVAMALNFNSVPLLSLALCRAHVCIGSEHRCKTTGDHSLHEALEMKLLDAISLLVKHGSKELLHEPCAGTRPLNRALKNIKCPSDTNYYAAELLLEHGADPNLASGPNMDSPLHQAAADGVVHAVLLLLKNGANPNGRNAELITPLHSLCRADAFLPKGAKEQVVKTLLEHGADPTKTDQYGHRATDYLPGLADAFGTGDRDQMTNRIRDRLQRAVFLRGRLQLTLARGCNESDLGFSRLPMVVLETIANFI